MDIKLFQQKLNDICAIAEENNKQLSQQQIRDHLDESDLSTSQLVKILQYLKLKGITIEGADEGTAGKPEQMLFHPNPATRKSFRVPVLLLLPRNRLISVTMESARRDLIRMISRPSSQAFAKGDTCCRRCTDTVLHGSGSPDGR